MTMAPTHPSYPEKDTQGAKMDIKKKLIFIFRLTMMQIVKCIKKKLNYLCLSDASITIPGGFIKNKYYIS